MKSISTRCSVLLLALALMASSAHATKKIRSVVQQAEDDDTPVIDQPLGVGIMLGDLNGISGKYWTSSRNAFDGGFSYAQNDYTSLHADYLWNIGELLGIPGRQKPKGSFASPYFGVGGIAYFDISRGTADPDQDKFFARLKSTGIALGARVPLGIEYQPGIVPCGLFAEFAPGLILVPAMASFVQAEGGVRFYF
jgi:hypothetical protein